LKRVLTADNLIGDLLMQTPTMRELKSQYPGDELFYHVPKTDTGVHVSGTHVLLDGNENLDGVFIGDEFTPGEEHTVIRMDSMKAYLWGVNNGKTLVEGFGHQAGVEINSLYYDYFLTDAEIERGEALAKELGKGRPIVVCARHSASCGSNDPNKNVANKCIPNHIWVGFAQWLSQQGYMPVAVGAARDERDIRYRHWWGEKCYGKPLRDVAALLHAAEKVVSIDTGIRHMTAAVGTDLFTISGTILLSYIRCIPMAGQTIFEEHRAPGNVTVESMIDGFSKIL
jgi:ADP-heptose:LPS heptosyltransferase